MLHSQHILKNVAVCPRKQYIREQYIGVSFLHPHAYRDSVPFPDPFPIELASEFNRPGSSCGSACPVQLPLPYSLQLPPSSGDYHWCKDTLQIHRFAKACGGGLFPIVQHDFSRGWCVTVLVVPR